MAEDIRLRYADKVTLERIQLMHPKLRASLLEEYLTINMRLPKRCRLRITHTLRKTSEQRKLYAQGRTAPGKIVTNAKPGQSIHEYGLAFDIVLLYDLDGNGTFETASYDERKNIDGKNGAEWMEVVNFFKSKGWSWGGDFKSIYDSPHFEKTFGKTWRDFIGKVTDANPYPVL